MDKVEIDVEILKEIQRELRSQRVENMELLSQLDAVKRLLGSIHFHLPKESSVEYMPSVVSTINQIIEKSQKKDDPKSSKAVAKKTK